MRIFLSFSGTRTQPVYKMYNELNNRVLDDDPNEKINFDKVYLLTSNFDETVRDENGNDVEIHSWEQTELLAQQIWNTKFFGKPLPTPVMDGPYRSYGKYVYIYEMKKEESFDYDLVMDRVIKINHRNHNPEMYINVTNGNQAFTCALSAVVHEIGGRLYYLKWNENKTDSKLVLIKKCEGADNMVIGVPAQNVLRAIGELIDLHENLEEKESKMAQVDHYSEYNPDDRKAMLDPSLEYTLKTSPYEGGNTPASEGYCIKQKLISEYTGKYWNKAISSQMVSNGLSELANKKLVKIVHAITVKGKINNKENYIKLTTTGGIKYSRLPETNHKKAAETDKV